MIGIKRLRLTPVKPRVTQPHRYAHKHRVVRMKSEQKIVAIGASSGVILMSATVWFLTRVLPTPVIADILGQRLAYAMRANVFATLPLFIMLATVGNSRFLSEAIDPTKHAESRSMEIDGRVADNTLQQNFLFAIASLTLSTVVPLQHLQIVWACAIVFVVARAGFWLGYRLDPLYRAPGMSATAYMNLGMIVYVLYRTFVG
jgi:MAPEG family